MIEKINDLLNNDKESCYNLGIALAYKYEKEFEDYYGIGVYEYEILIQKLIKDNVYTYGKHFSEVKSIRLKKIYFQSYKFLNLFPNLTELSIVKCGIFEIPKELYNLTHLEELSIGMNKISHIDDDIVNLKELTIINISYNKFIFFPEKLLDIENLEYIDVSGNDLLDGLKYKTNEKIVGI